MRYNDYNVDSIYGYRQDQDAIVNTISSVQAYELGTILTQKNGDEWIYCRSNSVTPLNPGLIVQGAAFDAVAFRDLAVDEPAAGTSVFVVTTGVGGGLLLNILLDGTIHVNDDTGEGHVYKIKSNTACAAQSSSTIVIYDTIKASLGVNSTVTLVYNKCLGVSLAPTTPTGNLIGVPQQAIPVSSYFWAKKKGYSAVLTDGTLVIGDQCSISNVAAGGVEPVVVTQAVIGRVVVVCITTEYSLIDLDM
jgi:hypothetical protein